MAKFSTSWRLALGLTSKTSYTKFSGLNVQVTSCGLSANQWTPTLLNTSILGVNIWNMVNIIAITHIANIMRIKYFAYCADFIRYPPDNYRPVIDMSLFA